MNQRPVGVVPRMPMPWELIWQIYGELLLAGALGGVVRWAVNKETLRDGAMGVLIGAILAYYMQPIAGQWFRGLVEFAEIDPSAARGCGAFLIGLCGIWPAQFVIDWGRKRFEIKTGGQS